MSAQSADSFVGGGFSQVLLLMVSSSFGLKELVWSCAVGDDGRVVLSFSCSVCLLRPCFRDQFSSDFSLQQPQSFKYSSWGWVCFGIHIFSRFRKTRCACAVQLLIRHKHSLFTLTEEAVMP